MSETGTGESRHHRESVLEMDYRLGQSPECPVVSGQSLGCTGFSRPSGRCLRLPFENDG